MGAPGHRDPHAQRQRLRVVKPLYASADAAVECGHTPAAALLDVLAVVTVGCKVGTVACVQCCAGHDSTPFLKAKTGLRTNEQPERQNSQCRLAELVLPPTRRAAPPGPTYARIRTYPVGLPDILGQAGRSGHSEACGADAWSPRALFIVSRAAGVQM